jgi:HemK-like putative methylase
VTKEVGMLRTQGNKITWLGHATFRITTPAGGVILIDPWVTGNPSCPEPLKKFERIDVLLITHGHSDHFADALALARANAARHGVSARREFVQSRGLESFAPAALDLVVSNPPYVSTAEWRALPREIRDHEPRVALDGGADGLAVLAPLVAQAAEKLAPAGWLALEIGEDQGRRVRGLMKRAGFVNIALHQDLAGWDRVAVGMRRM